MDTSVDWRSVLPMFGIHERHLFNRHGPCPICGGKDRFRFDDKNGRGTWICNRCGAGDGVKLVMLVTGMTRGEALRAIADRAPGTLPTAGPRPEELREDPADLNRRREALQRTWDEAGPLEDGDPSATYLTRRIPGFGAPYPSELRCHPALPYRHIDIRYGRMPALIARVRDAEGRPINLHRIYLTEDGRKADVPVPKKLMRGTARASGGAVRLYPPGRILAVAEGVETALAVRMMTGLPVWSAVSAGLLANLVVPRGVREVRIYADLDSSGAGQGAAAKLARRLRRGGIRVSVFLPKAVDTDFLDEWVNLHRKAA